MRTLTGRCHCGAVAYTINGEVETMVNCHCNMCRAMNGAAFSSYAIVSRAGFSITQGQEVLGRYAVTDTGIKHYCIRCGSPLFNTNIEKYGDHAMLYLGTLRNPGQLPNPINIFHEDRLAWTDAVAGLTSFPRLPRR
ncbi:MAG TPA: GFA family protein [Gammaproteobacteria bacterium]|nr:GFA family protein [Gammaproteobacteria bacterium]